MCYSIGKRNSKSSWTWTSQDRIYLVYGPLVLILMACICLNYFLFRILRKRLGIHNFQFRLHNFTEILQNSIHLVQYPSPNTDKSYNTAREFLTQADGITPKFDYLAAVDGTGNGTRVENCVYDHLFQVANNLLMYPEYGKWLQTTFCHERQRNGKSDK